MNDPTDFDMDEKASYFMDSWDLPQEPEEVEPADDWESYMHEDKCPVRIRIIGRSKTIAEMIRGFKGHAHDYCVECGQTEFLGYERPDMGRKKAA